MLPVHAKKACSWNNLANLNGFHIALQLIVELDLRNFDHSVSFMKGAAGERESAQNNKFTVKLSVLRRKWVIKHSLR